MGFWEFEKETTKTCKEHLGDRVPESIKREARLELYRRGYTKEEVDAEEWKRTH